MGQVNLFADIKDKVVLVTGGYGYLGSAISEILADYGAVVYVGGRNILKFNEKFKNNDSIKFIELDVSDMESIELSFQRIFEKEKKIDVLINNAYFGAANHPEKLTSDEWRMGMEGGVNQYFDMIKTSIPYIKKSKFGKIINIASMYGVVVPDLAIYNGREEFLNPANYGTSKAAIIHLTKYYAMYLSKYQINVNTISPGPFPSKEVQKDIEFVQRLKDKTKLKRIGEPDDLKGVILLLASNSSNYITGQNISVDGGWTL
ncbi:gluconate 5-dehydrogenase [Lutibacter oricola]|uniref:Gluconate 5-dehydrogenase n=1 Tax=Lutibacter oricola TaxID=762486 RepID=A0A1H2TQE9_9FLAO|nr:SDR family oxidoreductase [Lutibacter oricola]SDW45514.1 gluconate 5-dehydrogenase [Lutibacter oricola]